MPPRLWLGQLDGGTLTSWGAGGGGRRFFREGLEICDSRAGAQEGCGPWCDSCSLGEERGPVRGQEQGRSLGNTTRVKGKEEPAKETEKLP